MQLTDNQGNVIDDLNPLPTKEVDSTIVKPVNVDSHASLTVQTHNAVSIPTVQYSNGSWIDTLGFSQLSVTLKNDGATSSELDVHWSNDGTNLHGVDAGVTNTLQYKTANSPIKARYVRIAPYNGDTIAHTVSAWIYLLT